MGQQLIILRTNEEVETLKEYLADKDIVTFDTETTGITEESEIIGYSVCAEPGLGFYVITAAWNKETQTLDYLETRNGAPEVMEVLKTRRLVMHNGVFDCSMVWNNYKVSLIDSLFADTMILAHLVDENRQVGLKELGAHFYGDSAKAEQQAMKESIIANGGQMTKANYELYKADAELIANYGAKDAILTYNLFQDLLPELVEEGMEDFFFTDESMPLLRGPTYKMNTAGLKVDVDRLRTLKKELEVEIEELKAFVFKEIGALVGKEYPGASAKNDFNPNSGAQMAWLLFEKLQNVYPKVSNAGQDLCKYFGMRTPYNNKAKKEFIETAKNSKGIVWREKDSEYDKKTRRWKGKAEVKEYWTYLSTDKAVLQKFSTKYVWVGKWLECKKLMKLLTTYVEGIESGMRYGVIHPNFLQHGTTSGRYSCRNPNFQNLPRDDKRVKSCIISRPGRVFVGADYSQLEPRVFASYSGDKRLLACFENGQDFYSFIGMEVFEKRDCSLYKKDDNFFGKKHEKLRDLSKGIALAATYGTTANKLGPLLGLETDEAQSIISDYFERFPSVELMMLKAHTTVKKQGYVENYFGRKRRIPDAVKIEEMYGSLTHAELPYVARNLLNLGVNHSIQSTAASITNRAAIRFTDMCKEAGIDAQLVLQVHDSLIAECDEKDGEAISVILREAMENTVVLPGVTLVADPKIGRNLSEV